MSIEIQLNKVNYYPGEKIQGELLVDVPKPIRARKVQLTFIGKEHTKVVRGSGKNRRVYVEDCIIVEKVVDVWTASQNGRLGPCNETFPFEFQLPVHALPSMVVRFNDAHKITYEIKAKIDRPLAFDPNVKIDIQVLPLPIEQYSARVLVESFQEPKGRYRFEVNLAKNVFIPGESVSGRVTFKKDPSMKARAVECAVVYTESATAEGHTDAYPYVIGTLRWEIDPSGEYYEWPFNIQTHQSSDYSVEGRLIRCFWMVDVKVDLPLKRDQHVQVPFLFLPLRAPVIP